MYRAAEVGTAFSQTVSLDDITDYVLYRLLQAKRGNSDLQTLQSCVSMVSEMEAVYLEDIAAARPHFKAIRNLCEWSAMSCLTLTVCGAL